MTVAAPRRVLRLATIGWGLGHLALGRRGAGLAWLAAEAVALTGMVVLTLLLADTTWYLLPYATGGAFIVLWATQAILAYRAAVGPTDDEASVPRRSPAAAIAWLTLPLLVWGAGFWLIAAGAGSPDAVLDRFVIAWPEAGDREAGAFGSLAEDPAELEAAAAGSLAELEALCLAGQLKSDCGQAPEALLRDVRIRLLAADAERASAVAELVRFERRETRLLGIFPGSELVPVPVATVLRLELAARPAPLGSARWLIVNAEAPAGVPVT